MGVTEGHGVSIDAGPAEYARRILVEGEKGNFYSQGSLARSGIALGLTNLVAAQAGAKGLGSYHPRTTQMGPVPDHPCWSSRQSAYVERILRGDNTILRRGAHSRSRMEEHRRSARDSSMQIWQFLTVELWATTFLDSAA